MEELLQLIIDLPIPNLTDKEWDIFDDIFSSLSDKSTIGFANKWKEIIAEFKFTPITSVKPDALITYLEKWIKMVNYLIKANRGIAAAWVEITNHQIDADALLDISIELLPEKLSLLKSCLPNIDKASYLERKNNVGFVLASLYSAVSAKIQQIESNQLALPAGKYADNIISATQLLKKKFYIRELTSLCESYQEYLETKAESIIKDNDTIGYHYYYNNLPRPANSSVISKMISSLDFEHQNLPCKEQTLPIVKKYLLLQDFLFTLKREHYTPQEKLTEFSEKFSNFELFISTPENGVSYVLKPFNDFIGFFNSFRYSREEEFFKKVKLLVEQVKVNFPSPNTLQPLNSTT